MQSQITKMSLSAGIVEGLGVDHCALRSFSLHGPSFGSRNVKNPRRTALRVEEPNFWTNRSFGRKAESVIHPFGEQMFQTWNFRKDNHVHATALLNDSVSGVLDIQVSPQVDAYVEESPQIEGWPKWWPKVGSYIDLDIHDLPHEAATLEWWYLNTHLTTTDDRQFSLFASFFRLAEVDNKTGKVLRHSHSITWGMTDVSKRSYSQHTLLDPCAPKKTVELLEACKEGEVDPLLQRALLEVYGKGAVPLPDRLMQHDAHVSKTRLELHYDGNRLEKTSDGRYHLTLCNHDGKLGAELVFNPETIPIRHGDGGVVQSGPKDEGMFYYFMPRCKVEGQIKVDGKINNISKASGWYDHEFGRPDPDNKLRQADAWNWFSAQLSNGYQVTAYKLFDSSDISLTTGRSCAVVIDPKGRSQSHKSFKFDPVNGATWTSTKTFVEYPIAWNFSIPELDIHLHGEAFNLPSQEFVTSLSKPAFWEGRVNVSGTFSGKEVSGLGFVERTGFARINKVGDFLKAVTKETLKAIHKLLPMPLTERDLIRLVGGPSRPHLSAGIDPQQFADIVVKPIRDVIDRSGKCWRSYMSMASMDVITGGDLIWDADGLAYAELMHVGSLIIDDVQDKSSIRRGHPSCHEIYGEPLAINAGNFCYFLAQLIPQTVNAKVSDHDKVKLYETYFETMRAAHGGQALDIDGFERMMPVVLEQGGWAAHELERRVLGVHLLKSGAPCASLARSGAQAGGGTFEQVEGMGNYYESVGVAFQIIDDVLNLRGFEGNLKGKGEDIAAGKVTLPVAKAMSMLPRAMRHWIWETIRSRPIDPTIIASVIDLLEECGALQACSDQATHLIESAWKKLDPLIPDSITKIRLRAFGWFVLDRHY